MTGSYRVPRPLRAVNLVALLLFLAGAALYVRAWIGLRELRSYVGDPAAPPFSAMALFNHYHLLSQIGVWLVVAAVTVAVIAAIAAVIHRRRAPATEA